LRTKHFSHPVSVALSLILAWLLFGALHPWTTNAQQKATSTEQALKSFADLKPIDVHVHVFRNDPKFREMLESLNLKVLDILVIDDTLSYRKQLEPQIKDALALVESSKGHVALCTTFDPYKFNDSAFTGEAVEQINRDFAHGAIAVKIWKNIGMEIKDPQGKFIMPDDPKFKPIYEDIEKQGKTLMAHDAEPDVAWGPPDPNDPSWSYYQENPQWFLYNRPGFPSKQQILEARDHVLEQNPQLRVVGVHLGSMEKSLDNIAAHLDRYPNFAIDTAARMEYLMMAPTDKLRAFLIKYQDRVLYGTDLDLNPDAKIPETVKEWESTYARDWKFLATDEVFESEGRKVQGLKLPAPVLDKIYRENAIHWIHGL
jgi:predicted TIM-barrel fold metal-dependent hydrolase